MKNEKLDELTQLADDVTDAIPELLLGGDGEYRDKSGKAVDRFELMRRLHKAQIDAEALYRALKSEPRRAVVKVPKGRARVVG